MNIKEYDQLLEPQLPRLSNLNRYSDHKLNRNSSMRSTSSNKFEVEQLIEKRKNAPPPQATLRPPVRQPRVTEIDITNLGNLTTSPIVEDASIQKLTELRRNVNNRFHSKLYIAIKGVPQLFHKDLNSDRFVPKIIEEVDAVEDFDREAEVGKITSLKQLSSSMLLHTTQVNKHISMARHQLKELIKPRKEVIDIMDWLDKQLQNINIESKITQLYKEKQTIFAAALHELIRQVSLECKERGILIRMLWDSNLEMANHLVQYLYRMMNQQERKSLHEVSRTHQLYQVEFEKLHTYIKQFKGEIAEKDERLDNMVRELRYVRKKDKKLEKTVKDYIRQIRLLQGDHQKLLEENIRLTMAHYHVDWQTACDMKRSMFESTQRGSLVTVKELEQQVQQELQEHEQVKQQNEHELNDMIQRYMQQIVRNSLDDDDDRKTKDLDFNFLEDKGTDTRDLVTYHHAHLDTEDLIVRKSKQTQSKPDVQTEWTQTGGAFSVNTSTQTYIQVPITYKNTDEEFRRVDAYPNMGTSQKIVYREKVVFRELETVAQTPVTLQSQRERGSTQNISIQPLDSQRNILAEDKSPTSRRIIEQLEGEIGGNDEGFLSQNLEHLRAISNNNQELQDLIGNGDVPVHRVKTLLKNNSQLFEDFVDRVRDNIQTIESDKQELKSKVYSNIIALEDTGHQLNDHRRMIHALQRDLKDLQDVAVDIIHEDDGSQASQILDSNSHKVIFKHSLSQEMVESKLQESPGSTLTHHVNIVSPIQNLNEVINRRPNNMVQSQRGSVKRQSQIKLNQSAAAVVSLKSPTTSTIKQKISSTLAPQRSTRTVLEEKKTTATTPVPGNPYSKSVRTATKTKSNNAEQSSCLFLEAFHRAKPMAQPSKNKGQIVQNITKTLQIIVNELIKLNRKNEMFQNPFHVIIYDHFIQRFGLKNVAERNYFQFIQNIYHLRHENDYLELFAKLLFPSELLELESTQMNELLKNVGVLYQDGLRVQLFVIALCNLDESGQRNSVLFDRMFTTIYKVQETYPKWIGKYLREKQITDMIKDYEQQDVQLMQQLSLFKLTGRLLDMAELTLQDVEKKLEIMMLSVNQTLGQPLALSSFILFYRNLVTPDWIGSQHVQLFEQELDCHDDLMQEPAMSSKQFVFFCSQHGLFTRSIEKQHAGDRLTKVRSIALKWQTNAKQLKWQLFSQKKYSNAHKRLFDILDNNLNTYESLSALEMNKTIKIICFAYDLLAKDIQLIQDEQTVSRAIPSDFRMLEMSFAALVIPKTYEHILK